MTLSIVIMISGTGSNMKSICNAIDQGKCAAQIAAIFSDRRNAKGLEFARQRGYPIEIVRIRDYPDRVQWDIGLAEKVAAYQPDLIVLAGFMKIIGKPLLNRFPSRIINLHPALLPSFPGTDGPKMALEAGVRLSGCTIHIVDNGIDTGPIIAQAAVPVYQDDDRESLHMRIQKAEHQLYPLVIDQIGKGKIELTPKLHVYSNRTRDEEILFSLSNPDDQL